MKRVLILLIFNFLFIFGGFNNEAIAKEGVVFNGHHDQRKIALTFDDGGPYNNVLSILNTLEHEDVRATFFLIGDWMSKNPNTVREIAIRNHEIGSHSYSHSNLKNLSYNQVVEDLNKTQGVFEAITNQKLAPYIRPPYGSCSNETVKAALDLGYQKMVLWNVDTYDWKRKSKSNIVNTVLSQARPGAIVLMHLNGTTNTARALPDIIRGLKNMGYEIVTVSEILRDNISNTIMKIGENFKYENTPYYQLKSGGMMFNDILKNNLNYM